MNSNNEIVGVACLSQNENFTSKNITNGRQILSKITIQDKNNLYKKKNLESMRATMKINGNKQDFLNNQNE